MSSKKTGTPTIAARLRLAREQVGLSQGQVAKLLGYHRPTISQLEAGDRELRADEVASFATLYHVRPGWILTGESVSQDDDPDIAIAARELQKLDKADLAKLLEFIRTLNRKPDADA